MEKETEEETEETETEYNSEEMEEGEECTCCGEEMEQWELNFIYGIAKARKNDKYGIVNAEGTEITPFIYNEMEIYVLDKEVVVYVQLEDKFFHLNKQGECVEDCPDNDFLEKYGIRKPEE